MAETKRTNEIVLPPGKFVSLQDATKGTIKTFVGPILVQQGGNEVPMTYEHKIGFKKVDDLELAIRSSYIAPEGYYAILTNPTEKGDQPNPGEARVSPDLLVGRKIVIPGPVRFALWPGQAAEVIRGHHLRSNQYLLCRVYNEDEARKNWSNAVVKTANTTNTTEGQINSAPNVDTDNIKAKLLAPDDLTVGKLIIIRGTEVSFYIPPTGISVVKDKTTGEYVREALTLKQLQYCRLQDEDGTQRYPRGPAVVFPEPTETFKEGPDEDNKPTKVFSAVELNAIQGLHIKITKKYTDMDLINPATGKKGLELNEGDEIFIRGGSSTDGRISIYYPREEHAIIKYDGKSKYFAVAVPTGEARYVMDRLQSIIATIHGPIMLLPNPIHEVIVRRALSDYECATWYPNNQGVLAYNRHLREVETHAPTTRQGVVSDGDFERSLRGRGQDKSTRDTFAYAVSNSLAMDKSSVGSAKGPASADEITRGSSYTSPRTITLGNKFQGVPIIKPFIGFAIMVVNTKGLRRVIQGPANVLLEYDETLEILKFSTGKPKTTDQLINTPYLRTKNNKVTDEVTVETSDHVSVKMKISYLVNFEGDPNKWFEIENYVKFLCDHMRSWLKGAIRKYKIEEFYANSTEIIQDLITGKKAEDGAREGYLFPANGMRVSDVEVLDVTIPDSDVARMLAAAQKDTIQSNISLSNAKRSVDTTIQKERLNLMQIEAEAAVISKKLEIETTLQKARTEVAVQKLLDQILTAQKNQELEVETQKIETISSTEQLGRQLAQAEQQNTIEQMSLTRLLSKIDAETVSSVKRLTAMKDSGINEALMTLSSNETIERIAAASSAQRLFGGDNLVDVLSSVLGPLAAPILDAIRNKMSVDKIVNGGGKLLADNPHATT